MLDGWNRRATIETRDGAAFNDWFARGETPLSTRPSTAALSLALSAAPRKPAQAATCRIAPFSMLYGVDSQSHMDVSSGAPCRIRIGAGRGRTYSAGGGSDLAVSAQAQHGRVTLIGPREIGYRSSPGYVGSDQFTFETTGETLPVRGPARRGTAHVMVDVAVGR